MRTISVLLCFVCIGCTAVPPPATMMRAPAPTPTFTATPRSTPLKTSQERLFQPIGEDDGEACSTGGGDE
jgi:hypothetical protein